MSDSETFDIERRREPGRLVVAPRGELDIAAIDRMRGAMADRAADEALEIDLRGLEFLDTSGLAVLVEAHRAAQRDGFDLTLIPGSPAVQRVFEIAGLDRVLPFSAGAA